MKTKKWTALLLSLVMMLGLSSCVGDIYANVCTVDGAEINAGLYQMAQYSAYSDAKSRVENSDKNVLRQKVEGENASAWIKKRTEELVRQYVLVHRLCRERGISVSESGQQSIEQTLNYWGYLENLYNANGISQESFQRYLTNEELSNSLFEAMYAEGGELYVPDEQLKQEYAEKNAYLRFFTMPSTASDENVDATAQLEEAAAAMVEKLRAGQSMEQVVTSDLKKAYELAGREFTSETPADNITNSYVSYAESNYAVYSEGFITGLQAMAIGDFNYYNMGSSILIYEKIPAFSEGDTFESMRSGILSSLKRDEYEAHLKTLYNDYTIDWVFGARWYYRPSKIKDSV